VFDCEENNLRVTVARNQKEFTRKDGLEKMLFKSKLKTFCTSLSLCQLHASGIKFFSKTDAYIFRPEEIKCKLLYLLTDLRQIENNVTGSSQN
jgi:hypothetical protein